MNSQSVSILLSMMSPFAEEKKQKSGNVHMKLEPSSGYQAAETMNTKELEFSQESHAERRENINPRCHGGRDVSQ